MKIKIDRKGFTLFTALISFLLIILSAVLVQSMIRAESNTVDIISDAQEQIEMQAVADLARADAMQVINYAVRKNLEEWLMAPDYSDQPENFFAIESKNDRYKDWDLLINEYTKSHFGTGEGAHTSQLASFVSNSITSILSSGSTSYGRYRVSIKYGEELELKKALENLIARTADPDSATLPPECGGYELPDVEVPVFEVINCEDQANYEQQYRDCVGTFYLNLDTRMLCPKEFEVLPQVYVKNVETGRVITEPVLPKGTFRMYVPIRLFKAVAGARVLAEKMFNNVHGNVAGMEYGMCSSGCSWNDDLGRNPVTGNYLCFGDGSDWGVSYTPSTIGSDMKTYVNNILRNDMQSFADNFQEIPGDDTFDLYEFIPISNISSDTTITTLVRVDASTDYDARCARLSGMQIDVFFAEKSPDYMVRHKENLGKNHNLVIRLIDNGFELGSLSSYNCVSDASAPDMCS